MNISEEVKKIVEGDVETSDEILTAYSEDYSIFKVKPQAVVSPKNEKDIMALVRFAAEKALKNEPVSLTGRSAGTDMSGGPLSESLIVEFKKYFNHIREIHVPSFGAVQDNNSYAVVEPGVYFRDFEKELNKKGLLYPAYPASKDLCALGGMVMNNSGGEKTLEYGKTEDYIEGLHVVLSDGEEHYLKPLSAGELKKKLAEEGFEGDIYRKLYKLIEDNYDAIKAAKPKVSKNSAGYYLWNVWDKKTFDITKLIVGSQGTLGLMTAARLRLVKAKKYSRLAVMFAKSLDPVPALVKDILKFGPESIESYDDKTLGLAIKFLPAMLKMMKGSAVKLFFQFIPELLMLVRGGLPKMVLLVQLTGDDERVLGDSMRQLEMAAKKYPVRVRLVASEAGAEKYWTIRRQSFNLLHSHVKGMYAAPFIDDIIVDPKYMTEFLPQVNAILDRYKDKFIYTIAGHPGNGNFHIIPLVDLKDEETRKLIPKITEEVYQLVFKYGGSITAEHNDGLIRTPYLEEMYGGKIVSLFAEVKKIFDPLNIFNPGKKVNPDMDYALKHVKRV
ncbi:MAG: FAD-binding oxidoreductase [Minisyncoccia bacterium]|jgi:FAD/FMN-containing dehydrogenase